MKACGKRHERQSSPLKRRTTLHPKTKLRVPSTFALDSAVFESFIRINESARGCVRGGKAW